MSIAWELNPGFCPAEAKGKNVHVKLRNGYTTTGWHNGKPPLSPKGWPADRCNWSLSKPHKADIIAYAVT